MNRLLITGGNGFLGKEVVKRAKYINSFNAGVILSPSSTELDLTNESSVMTYFDKYRPSKILHMAAACGGLGLNKKQPADLTHLNLKMVVNLFDAVHKYNVEYVYGIGTVCSYPMYCPVPFKEDDIWNGMPEITNSGYGLSKRMLLILQSEYRKQYGLKGAHLIPINLMGPGDSFDDTKSHVIPALIKKFVDAVDNNKPQVFCYGTGTATREFLAAEDCAEAIVKAISVELDYEGPINLGTGKSILIKDIAELIGELTGYKGKIVFTGEVGDGQPLRQLDVSRAKAVLGWEAKIDLREGLKRTIKWYKENK
jgi:GDP-L-fucose synthase